MVLQSYLKHDEWGDGKIFCELMRQDVGDESEQTDPEIWKALQFKCNQSNIEKCLRKKLTGLKCLCSL